MFEELEPRDRPSGVALISEILDGLPASLARMSRTEFTANPSVSELTRELQVLVPRWRKDFGKDFVSRQHDSGSHDRDRHRRHPTPRTSELPTADRAPLSASYDKSKIGMQLHPVTKKLTRCYTKPNGSVIFMNRNCSRCHEAHFDFEHDTVRPTASARLVLDEFGYEMWEQDSDAAGDDDLLTKKLN